MAGMKRMLEKMADQCLQSFIVTFNSDQGIGCVQFWATDHVHAGEQGENAYPYCDMELIETQEEFEKRNGLKLDYGTCQSSENVVI